MAHKNYPSAADLVLGLHCVQATPRNSSAYVIPSGMQSAPDRLPPSVVGLSIHQSAVWVETMWNGLMLPTKAEPCFDRFLRTFVVGLFGLCRTCGFYDGNNN